MGRAPCCDKANVKKGPWSPEEDVKLKDYIQKHGTAGNWIALPLKAGLKRCGKSCRLRWLNYLRPDIKHGDFSDEEDRVILNLFTSIGSRWSVIAAQLAGRTDNDIKNYWNTKLKKKFMEIPQQYSSSTLLSEKFPILEPSSVISSSSPPPPPNYYNTPTSTPPSTFITSSYEQKPSLVNRAGLETYNQNIHSMNQFQENFMRFGGEASSSSDDGSSSTNQMGCKKETEQDLHVDLQGYLCSSYGVMDHHVYQNSYGFYNGGNQLDHSLEEIKQLISTNHHLGFTYLV